MIVFNICKSRVQASMSEASIAIIPSLLHSICKIEIRTRTVGIMDEIEAVDELTSRVTSSKG